MNTRIQILIIFTFCVLNVSGQIKRVSSNFYDFDDDEIVDVVFEYTENYSDLYHTTFSDINVIPKDGTQIAYLHKTSDDFINYFEFNDSINSNLDWTDQSCYVNSDYYNFPNSYDSSIDYFIGVQIMRNDKSYYGWIRLIRDTEFTHQGDAAVQLMPDTPILAGDGIEIGELIKPIVCKVEDLYDNNDWSDFQITFYSPFYYNNVEEYRLFVFRSNDIPNINIDYLLSVPENNYQKIQIGNGLNRIRLNEDLINKVINFGEKYQFIVLSVSNNVDSFPHAYAMSDTIVIKTILPKAGMPVVLDIGEENNSRDLQIEFKKNNHEDFTGEYRIMIVPQDSEFIFELENAIAIPIEHCFTIEPVGDSIYTIENINITDINGVNLGIGKMYNTYVYSTPDNIHSDIGSLSLASNTFSIGTPNYIYAGQIEDLEYENFATEVKELRSDFDFDDDNTLDLSIISYVDPDPTGYKYGYEYKHTVEIYNNTQIIVVNNETSNYDLARKCPFGEVLKNEQNWGTGKYTLYYESKKGDGLKYGEFKEGGIIGFRKSNLNDTIYGWIQVKIKDYNFEHIITKFGKKKFNLNSNNELVLEPIENEFVLYPNPIGNKNVNITINNFIDNEDYYFDVLSSTGEILQSVKVQQKNSQINLAINVKGLYYIRMRTEWVSEIQKIMLL